jgi:hypothetical protein
LISRYQVLGLDAQSNDKFVLIMTLDHVIKFYNIKNIKNIILIYFWVKNILKNNNYYILKQQVVKEKGKRARRKKMISIGMLTLAFVSGSLATDDLCHM